MIIELTRHTALIDVYKADFVFQRVATTNEPLYFRVLKNRHGRVNVNMTFDQLDSTFRSFGEELCTLNKYAAPIAINKSSQKCKPVVVSF